MSIGDLLAIEVIAVVGVLLLIGTIIPGLRLYWPRHTDPVSRSDLGVALMGGALIAFAVLGMQLMVQFRAEADANQRETQADRQELLLILGRSRDLSGLDLRDRNLSGAYLNGKMLNGAILEDVKMSNASLERTQLVGAKMAGAELDGARLQRADLRYADLAGASLVGAKLKNVKLDAASLRPRRDVAVDLSRADLTNAWVRADLNRAILRDAILIGTHLASANLQGADLAGANLEFVDLRGANLKGAKLEHARFADLVKDLSLATYDKETTWPDAIRRPPCPFRECTVDETEFGSATELVTIRETLEEATNRENCLPGWWVDERKLSLYAHEPQDRAKFRVARSFAGSAGARAFAQGLDGRPDEVQPINTRIDVRDARNTYAERFENGDSYVAVYYVQGKTGFSLWGSASPEVFPVFQRDFLKLFRIMGVTGEVFASVPDEKDGCPK